jgi:hypothetical protein
LQIDLTMHADSTVSTDVQLLIASVAIARVQSTLSKEALWRVGHPSLGAMLYQPEAGLLWQAAPDRVRKLTLSTATEASASMQLGGLQGWRVPTLHELQSLLQGSKVSTQQGNTPAWLGAQGLWLCTTGGWDTASACLIDAEPPLGCLIAVNDFVGDLDSEAMILLCFERGWSLAPADAGANTDLLELLKNTPARALFADLDYIAARLPKLEQPFFDDPACGLWELWGGNPQILSNHGVRARNPAEDVLDWDVAIDFGTRSTVVAYSEHGRRKLLRVGLDRFWEAGQPESYANPTALEFVDIQRFLTLWRKTAYRPSLSWDDVRCSHAALAQLDDTETMHALVPGVLTGLKQWALRGERDARIHVRDAQGYEHTLAPLTARNPVLGMALNVGKDDPFDPIELYAWFLGMNINWRGRGIFLRYYMSFPVAYPEYVRDRILASFRRGLQRSLPATLVNQPVFAGFRVEELASEPAAYAAAALPALGIAPTADGAAYAVFDFGGGTTDFEFGKYRLPTADEDLCSSIILTCAGNRELRSLGRTPLRIFPGTKYTSPIRASPQPTRQCWQPHYVQCGRMATAGKCITCMPDCSTVPDRPSTATLMFHATSSIRIWNGESGRESEAFSWRCARRSAMRLVRSSTCYWPVTAAVLRSCRTIFSVNKAVSGSKRPPTCFRKRSLVRQYPKSWSTVPRAATRRNPQWARPAWHLDCCAFVRADPL